MASTTIKTSVRDCRIVLMVTCIIILSVVDLGSSANRKINCRKYVHAPECRGIAAKRDTARFNDDYRLPFEDREVSDLEKPTIGDAILTSRNILGELIRRAIERNLEYDTGNYLK